MASRFLATLLVATSLSSVSALAQDTLTSGSASNSDAVSGSQSGAQSDNNSSQGQQQNNAGIGNSVSGSASDANANANTSSSAESNGNQQGQSSSNTNQLGASNQQGVQVSTEFNTYNRKKTTQEFRTNAAVPLAASSSFSSDYCGGTTSGGASVAPLGISLGAASPTFDNSCRYLRVAEKAGMLGANYYNMKQADMAGRAMSMMAWALCMAGPQQDKRKEGYKDNLTMEACLNLGLLGSEMSPTSPPPQPAPEPQVQQYNGQPTPEAIERYKTPRGELEYRSDPVIQEVPIAMVAH